MPKKGYKQTTEHRKKLSLYRLGKKNPKLTEYNHKRKGKLMPIKHRNNISKSLKIKYGDKTKINKAIRDLLEYRQWRSDVFTRDDFTCQECGQKGGKLEAHHIKEFIKIINEYKIKSRKEAIDCAELWNINNGITLCQKCHDKSKQLKYLENELS